MTDRGIPKDPYELLERYDWVNRLSEYQFTREKALGVKVIGDMARTGHMVDGDVLLPLLAEVCQYWLQKHRRQTKTMHTRREISWALYEMASYIFYVGLKAGEAAQVVSHENPQWTPETLKSYFDRMDVGKYWKQYRFPEYTEAQAEALQQRAHNILRIYSLR